MSLAIILMTCNLVTVALAILTIVHIVALRKSKPVIWLFFLIACLLIGSFSAVALFLTETLNEKVLFFYLRALSTLFIPTVWLYFISSVFGYLNWLHKRSVSFLMFAPAIINFLLIVFPSTRSLLFTDFQLFAYHGLSLISFKLENTYFVFAAWSTALMFFSLGLGVFIFIKESHERCWQIFTLNIGFLVAFVGYLSTDPSLDWIVASSFSILVTQAGIFYALVRLRLLNVTPLIRLHEDLEFRNQLLALLAHDLTGFAESQSILSMSLQKNVGLDDQKKLELLSNSVNASQDLVQNLVVWAKSQNTQFKVQKNIFEWNTLIRESIEQLATQAAIKNISIDFAALPAPLLTMGDSEMLSSVFRNVLNNAIRATPEGKKIFIALSTNKSHVEVKIQDQGKGIEARELERIRKITKEFSLTGLSKAQGAGIGLMIARHFISLHEGNFHIDSNLGIGTEVFFSIPL